MHMIAGYNDIGSYMGTAVCGVDRKTVKRAVAGQRAGRPARAVRPHNYDVVAIVVTQRVGRTSAHTKRLLPQARARH
jgi:hypothetical protein